MLRRFVFCALLLTLNAAAADSYQRIKESEFRATIFQEMTAFSKKKYAEALPLLRRASCGGDAMSQKTLGEMYVVGLGTTQDVALGYAWLAVSAEPEMPGSRALMEQILSKLTTDQKTIVQHRAEQLSSEYGLAATHAICTKAGTTGTLASAALRCDPPRVGASEMNVRQCDGE